jgi:hypothetical protein
VAKHKQPETDVAAVERQIMRQADTITQLRAALRD